MDRYDSRPAAGGGISRISGARNRDSLFLMANFRRAGSAEVLPIRVRNLSEGGLMAELPQAVEPDALVEVEVRGLGWMTGRIAWQVEGRTGIAFDRLIDPQRARQPVGSAARATPFMASLPPRR